MQQENTTGKNTLAGPKNKSFGTNGKIPKSNLGGKSDVSLENFYAESEDLGGGRFSLGIYVFKIKITKNDVEISLDGVSYQMIFTLLVLLGYRKWYTGNNYEFIHQQDGIMDPVTDDIMKSHVVRIAESEVGPLTVEYRGGKATFSRATLLEVLRRHVNAILNKSFFETLPRHNVPLLRDTKEAAYFPFTNGVLKVSTTEAVLIPYSSLDGVTLWRSHIIKRPFAWNNPISDNCSFLKVIINLTSGDEIRAKSLGSAIGYVLHNYNHSARGVALMLYDEKPTRKGSGNGGTGKGLICQGVVQMREGAIIDGKSFDKNNRFGFQCVNTTTQVLILDDVKSDMEFSSLYSIITEGIAIEKKNEQAIKIPAKESPKIIITSNNIVGGSGTSDIRRQFIVELSDYYSSRIKPGGVSPVEQEHGILFDDDTWTAGEWNAFYSFMVQCVQLYLTHGLVPYEFKNIAHNRILQHCGEDFATWVFQQGFTVGHEYNLDDLYHDYVNMYYAGATMKFTFKTFGNHIKTFGEANGWACCRRRSNHVNYFTYLAASNGGMETQVAESGCKKPIF